MKNLMSKSLLILLFGFVVSACSDNDDEVEQLQTEVTELQSQVTELEQLIADRPAPSIGLVQTVAPDYSISQVDRIDAISQQVQTGYYLQDASDYSVFTNGNDVYHLGRYGIDTITKYSAEFLESMETQVWSYTTQDNGDTTTRNLYSIAFLNDTKAYIVRYGSDKVWVVNPAAENAEDFKIGELDLSAYVENNSSSTPRPASALIHDGKLFVVMQRLDDAWSPQTAYVAVFNTETDEEIETNANAEDSVKGIPLAGLNPLENSLSAFGDTVYVTSNDSYSSLDQAGSKIEAINTVTYELSTVVEAQSLTENTGSAIHQSVIVSDEKGYFVATKSLSSPFRQVSTVYEFNPTTGDIVTSNVAATGEEDVNHIAVDDNGFLWLSVASASTPGIDIIDTRSNQRYFRPNGTVVERLLTELNPGKIAFLD